jgi:putative transposase
MPRTRRIAPDNCVHHVLNRGNRRETIFRKDSDYRYFFNLVADALERTPVRLLAICGMPNHFHMVVWPERGLELSAYMEWLSTSHVHHYHHHYRTTGEGHIYQGRFKNFLVQDSQYFYRVVRYVETNPVRAGLVTRADEWPWSSAGMRTSPDGRALLSEWPLPRPLNWLDYVNKAIPADELASLRNSTRRGAPYGDEVWREATVAAYGLESTIRPRGRQPRSQTAT